MVFLTGCVVTPIADAPQPPSRPPVAAQATLAATPRATIMPGSTATARTTSTPTVTLTPTDPAATPTLLAPQPTPTLPALDEAARGALFDNVWNTVDEHYLYPDFRGVNWDALKAERRAQAVAAPNAEAFYAVLRAMVGELKDEHSRFEDPQAAFVQRAIASGTDTYVGIGVLTQPADDGLLITTVFPGSPAADAGIKRRDMIVRVNGAAVDVRDPGISGPDGSTVTLDVREPDGAIRTSTLARRPVLAQYVPDVYLLPGTRTGYVVIQSFWAENIADKTSEAIGQLLDAQPDMDGLIVDVRGNGGGWRSVLETLLGNFVQGEVGTWARQTSGYPLTLKPGPLYDRLSERPMVVLVDRDTKSYAEVFAAALQAQKRAAVVGSTSAGNTETIFAYDFEDGSRVWVAQEGFELPDGTDLEGRGVVPDRVIDVEWTQFSEARDPHILEALDLIRQKRAESAPN